MSSFSIDKQRGQVNAEWMSRPVDTFKKLLNNQPLVLVLTSMAQSPTFASRLKRKLLSGPILGGAYNAIGDYYLSKGDTLQAIEHFKKVLTMADVSSTKEKLGKLKKHLN